MSGCRLALSLSLFVAIAGCQPVPNAATATPVGSQASATTPATPITLDMMQPSDVAVDGQGNLYVSDRSMMRIYRVDRQGTATLFAKGTFGDFQEGASAQNVSMNQPEGLGLDAAGNLYVATGTTGRVIRIDSKGIATSAPGKWGFLAADPDLIRGANDVAVDAAGNLYVAEYGDARVFKISPKGEQQVLVSDRSTISRGGQEAKPFGRADQVALDRQGRLLITESRNHRVLRVDADGQITIIAGTDAPGFGGDGGPAAQATLQSPHGIAVDANGNIYIADTGNRRIRKIDGTGTITTFAGTDNSPSVFPNNGDGGQATAARLIEPQGMACDSAGNLYVADATLMNVRRISTTGTITTVCAAKAATVPTNTPALPYGIGALNLPTADQGFVVSLISSLDSLRTLLKLSGNAMAAAPFNVPVQAQIQPSVDAGYFTPSRSSSTNADGTVTETLTTNTADKLVSDIETIARTMTSDGQNLVRLTYNLDTRLDGASNGNREQTTYKRTVVWQSAGIGNDTITVSHMNAQGDPDWSLSLNGLAKAASDNPAGGTIVVTRGSTSRQADVLMGPGQGAKALNLSAENRHVTMQGIFAADGTLTGLDVALDGRSLGQITLP